MENFKSSGFERGGTAVAEKSPESEVAEASRVKITSITRPPVAILRPRDFVSEVLTPKEMTLGKVDEISDFFRWIFDNDWNQFAVCAPCEVELKKEVRMSAPEAFGSKEHIPLERLDDPANLPCCPHCSNKMKWFHDPGATRKNLRRKLLDLGDGYASLIRNPRDGKIAGFSFGYGATLKDEFEGEWKNRYLYMRDPHHKAGRDLEELIESLNHSFPGADLRSESKVFAWNCVGLAPEARFGVLIDKMMSAFFSSTPVEKRCLYVVGEAIRGSPAHGYFKSIGASEIDGFIEGKETMMVGNLGKMTDMAVRPVR